MCTQFIIIIGIVYFTYFVCIFCWVTTRRLDTKFKTIIHFFYPSYAVFVKKCILIGLEIDCLIYVHYIDIRALFL